MQTARIKNYRRIGVRNTLDLEVDSEYHNFICEGLVTSNSHAVSYAALAAQMVYLKFKYPQTFFLKLLEMTHERPDPFSEISLITQELPKFGIKLLQPDVVESGLDFKKEGPNIRYGLKSIKGISDKSLDNLKQFVKEKRGNKFELFQAGCSAKINIGQLTALIYTGALESASLDTERRLLALECAGWYLLKDGEKAFLLQHGDKYEYSFGLAYKDIDNWKKLDGKNVARKTRKKTISKGLETARQIYAANNDNNKFAFWKFEKELLGYAYTYRLQDVFNCDGLVTDVVEALKLDEGDNVSVIGEVYEVRKWISPKQNHCLKVTIIDELGSIDTMLVGEPKIELLKEQGLIPVKGDIVVAKGQKAEGDLFWLDRIKIQEVNVVFKKSDLTKDLSKKDV